MRPQFLPFGRPDFGPEEERAVLRVLRERWVGMGKETLAFEEELAAFLSVPAVVSVNSCTSALFLSLLVSGIRSGDEVIVPSLTWCSSANAGLYLDAKPVFCDVDPESLCATWKTIAPRITERTKAVVLVHYGGLAAEAQQIRKRLPSGIALIEDAAHAFGARHGDGSMVGSLGNLTCFSFYANKNLSCGEGGAIALGDADLADRLRRLRLHGLTSDAWKRFLNREVFETEASELGYKMNLTDLQASIGRVQLRRQAEFHDRRTEVVRRYMESLPDAIPGVTWQNGWDAGRHTGHLFVVRLPVEELEITRDQFLLELRARNIGASIHYLPLHRMTLYRELGVTPVRLPVTDWLHQRIITLPISASMSVHDCDDVISAVSEINRRYRLSRSRRGRGKVAEAVW